jgi:hypothetical protein
MSYVPHVTDVNVRTTPASNSVSLNRRLEGCNGEVEYGLQYVVQFGPNSSHKR